MLAEDPAKVVPGATLAQRAEAWRRRPALYQTPQGTVRAAADEAYLWIEVETADGRIPDELYLGFDVIDPRRATSAGRDARASGSPWAWSSCCAPRAARRGCWSIHRPTSSPWSW
jgi:hypothetical protein